MKAVIVNDMIGLITGVDEDGDAVVEFGGSYQLQISKVDNEWKVTNGVNGYGNNCRKEFEDATVIPLYESPAPDGWVSEAELNEMTALKDYWYNRCYHAEKAIEASPCDPDITPEQIEAHRLWNESKKDLPQTPKQ